MSISKRTADQMRSTSWIRSMFEDAIELRRAHGAEHVFDLSLGNPLLEPPPEFTEALRRLAADPAPGTHRYMPNGGYPETRAAVARQLSAESGIAFEGNDILMTVGAAGALNVILRSILDDGDEIVVLSPYFVEYRFYVGHQGGKLREAPCDEQFQPDLATLEAAITSRTRGVIINSPNNPTGVLYPAESVAGIGEVLRRAEKRYGTEIYLISDEPYRKIIYSDAAYPFVFRHHARSVVATSHSKDLGLAGERIGYLAVNPDDPGKSEFMNAATFALRTLGFVNAPALMQRVVAEIQHVTVNVDVYRQKRDYLYEKLTSIGYECVKPDGAFFLFPRSPVPDDAAFVKTLQSKLVLTVPGSGFGGPGHIRVSYCVEDRVLEGSIRGFREAFESVTAQPA